MQNKLVNFFKKNFIIFELVLFLILAVLLLVSVASFNIMWIHLENITSLKTSFFETFWMALLGPGYFIFNMNIFGVLVHGLLFLLFLSIPIIGFFYYRKKRAYILLHIGFGILLLVLSIFIKIAYATLTAFAGV